MPLVDEWPASLVHEPEEDEEENEAVGSRARATHQQLTAAERERTAQEQAFHQLYCSLVERFLTEAGHQLTGWSAGRFVRKLYAAAQEYREHPGLAHAEDISHRRLHDLYWMHDQVQGVVEDIAQQGFFGSGYSAYTVSKKKLRRLREHLVEQR
ncbi:hypothetical protein BXP70_25640 [Hymenobacter crusticola]|uniref:Uncharacterized protein n=1 Tax=Hymenobacter crusticola TaxID=1770526 RepID=A0A243W6V7_9BACT|nr:hypothetical protein BXP70_25640 [Hymenobacter crusticola]